MRNLRESEIISFLVTTDEMPVCQHDQQFMNGKFCRVSARSPVDGHASVQKRTAGQVSDELAFLIYLGEHPNIVRTFFALSKPHMLVLEACPASLEDILAHPVRPINLRSLVFDLLRGLSHMHQKGIAHHDIKPDNILLGPDQLTWKICDFGNAVSMDAKGECVPKCDYTMAYASPELVLSADVEVDICGSKADMWSFAVTILHVVCHDDTERDRLFAHMYGSFVLNVIRALPHTSQVCSLVELDCVQAPLKNLERDLPTLANQFSQLLRIKPLERPEADSLLKTLLL